MEDTAMKNKNEKSVKRILRQVGGKNILFVDDKAVGEFKRRNEFDYDPGDPVRDVATGLKCVGYLFESLSEAGNEPVDGMTCWGLSQALQHYAQDVRKYLKPIALSLAEMAESEPPFKVVPVAVVRK
jgi:hypothetical protein